MTIQIPEWLLWAIGIPAGIAIIVPVLYFAYVGWNFRGFFK